MIDFKTIKYEDYIFKNEIESGFTAAPIDADGKVNKIGTYPKRTKAIRAVIGFYERMERDLKKLKPNPVKAVKKAKRRRVAPIKVKMSGYETHQPELEKGLKEKQNILLYTPKYWSIKLRSNIANKQLRAWIADIIMGAFNNKEAYSSDLNSISEEGTQIQNKLNSSHLEFGYKAIGLTLEMNQKCRDTIDATVDKMQKCTMQRPNPSKANLQTKEDAYNEQWRNMKTGVRRY